MTFKSTNPATGETIAEYELLTDSQLEEAIKRGDAAFQDWRRTSFDERAGLMRKAADVLRKNKAEYAHLMSTEMGKPITQAEGELDKCAWAFEFNADNAADFLADETIETDATESFVTYQPMGVILAIMPWNFPFWQAIRFAAPHLMAGNAGLLKHAPNVGGCAKAIEDIFKQAGFPESLFQNLFIDTDQAAMAIAHPLVRAVTLTGSTGAGKAVATEAGKALKKVVLELGGSDAYLILDDADLDLAVEVCAGSRLLNSGQSCVNAKRFIVMEDLRQEFEQKLVAHFESVKVGDPLDRDTDIGPLARADLRDHLQAQVEKSLKLGAKCLVGAKPTGDKGCFYIPGVLTNLEPGMPAYDEELFGPVASVIGANDEKEAIAIANQSIYGLGSGVITRDSERGKRIAREELDAGMSFVNQFVTSDPRLPFGGVKESGYGRELSRTGILEFVNAKTVSIK